MRDGAKIYWMQELELQQNRADSQVAELKRQIDQIKKDNEQKIKVIS